MLSFVVFENPKITPAFRGVIFSPLILHLGKSLTTLTGRRLQTVFEGIVQN